MNTKIDVLLVEDNRSLAETVIAYLQLEDIDCDYAATGAQGLELARTHPYQVILLDINLPHMDGLEVCTVLRKEGVDAPVLMLTARDTIDDKLAGFDAGTDDYLVKPFELSEVVARIRVLSKRRSGQGKRLQVGSLVMDLSRKIAAREERELNLTPTCWKILELLMRESPNVVSREKIEAYVWGDEALPDTNSLKVHLYRLRQEVDKPFPSSMIHTVAKHGVALRAENA
ncbi:MAG: response regulator transcription factor [Pseudomonadota bacterium]